MMVGSLPSEPVRLRYFVGARFEHSHCEVLLGFTQAWFCKESHSGVIAPWHARSDYDESQYSRLSYRKEFSASRLHPLHSGVNRHVARFPRPALTRGNISMFKVN